MEVITLTEKNCHRAASVRPVGSTSQIWDWQYNAEKKPHSSYFNEYASVAVNREDGERKVVENIDKELAEWEVLSWKYEENFEDLYKAARDAFYATSHEPERRALQYIRSYEEMLQEDLAQIPEFDRANYTAKFRSWITTLFSKHSRIMSAAIVGPARFPTEKNRRANDAYDTASRDFQDWRQRYLKRSAATVQAMKPQEERDNEEWEAIKSRINRSAGIIFRGDTGIERCFDRALIVSNLYNSMATLAKNGKLEMIRRATEYITALGDKFKENGGKVIFTPRHKFWKLLEETEKRIEAMKAQSEKEDVEIEFDGGTLVKCYSENRLQIFHDAKPSADVIALLKREAWRWSPSNGCWQRQLTSGAIYSASRIIPLTVEQISKAV